jgi:hypothetical protein
MARILRARRGVARECASPGDAREHGAGAAWLQVTSLAGTSRTRPVVNEDIVGSCGGGTGPAWGYHSYEYALTLGNLLRDVAGQEAAWDSRR